jgi:hypothetical protein
MSWYVINREQIASRTDLRLETIDATPPPDGFDPRDSASGDPTARIDGKWIHSPRDPRQEAARLHPKGSERNSMVVFYGLGLAYQIEHYLENVDDAIAVVVEPEAAMVRAAFETRDLGALLVDPRVHLLIDANPQELAMVLRANEHRAVRTVRLRSVYSRNRDYYETLDAVQENFFARRDINGNTLRRFAGVWIRNLARNVPLLAGAEGLSILEGGLSGVPALLLAAGPSLDLVLPHLEQIRRCAVLVAVDTSAAALRDLGVEADLLVVVDPQWWNTRHLDRIRCENTILVSESSTHPRVFRLLDTLPLFAESLFPLGRYLERATRVRGALGAGGSVSTSAWDLSRLLGCSPIYCAGLDLGFPNARTHCRGSFFEERAHTLSGRLLPGEHQSFAYISQADPYRVPDNQGGTVLTDRRMAIYHWWFENQAQIHSNVDTRNLSPGGAHIRGFDFAPIEQLLALPERRDKIDTVLRQFRQRTRDGHNRGSDRTTGATAVAHAIETLAVELGRIETLCDRGLSAVQRARRARSISRPTGGKRPKDEVAAALRDLDAVDAELRAMDNRDIAGFLVQDTLARIMRGEHEQTSDPLETSLSVYEALKRSSKFHVVELNRSLSLLRKQPRM